MMLAKKIFFCLLVSLFVSTTLLAQTKEPIPTTVSFIKIQLLDAYVSEGASIGDIDNDGNMDIVAGSLWWKGPDFNITFAYAPIKYFPITGPGLEGYATNFFTFPGHFDDNQSTDILQVGIPGTDSRWVKNIEENSGLIKDAKIVPVYLKGPEKIGHESPDLIDVIGDKRKELLAFSNGKLYLEFPVITLKMDGNYGLFRLMICNGFLCLLMDWVQEILILMAAKI